MENFKVSDILNIIEDDQTEWYRSCEQICKNPILTDKQKDTIRMQCSVRIDALENLKYKFYSYGFR